MQSSIIFVNTYYDGFLNSHYKKYPEAFFMSYQDQKELLLSQCFGDSDFYSKGLEKAGFLADEIILNCVPLQNAWVKEHNLSLNTWDTIFLEQIKTQKPDIIYFQNMSVARREIISKIRPYVRLIVGQIASPLVSQGDYWGVDIMVSSFPHFVQVFRKNNITAYYQMLAFEPKVLKKLESLEKPVNYQERTYPVSFIGGFTNAHSRGNELLEKIAQNLEKSSNVPIKIWGYGIESLAHESIIKKCYQGEAWGLEMFSILNKSKITINRHIDIAKNWANNMRLFEATGCGALLITDYKDNLADFFDIGKEIIAYRSYDECIELIKYYLANPYEAEKIAKAGQEKTLKSHTYDIRMAQTSEFLTEHLRLSCS